jgi:hypothetical protein
MLPTLIGNFTNAKKPNVRRNVPYTVKDLKSWNVSTVLHLVCIPENKNQINKGANSKRAYFLYHGKSPVFTLLFFLLKMEGKSGRKLL